MKFMYVILAAIFTGDSGTTTASHLSKFHGLRASTSLADHAKKKNPLAVATSIEVIAATENSTTHHRMLRKRGKSKKNKANKSESSTDAKSKKEKTLTICHVDSSNPFIFNDMLVTKKEKRSYMEKYPIDKPGPCKNYCHELCDDSNMCTIRYEVSDEKCKCLEEPLYIDCDDGKPETEDSCNPSVGCVHLPKAVKTIPECTGEDYIACGDGYAVCVFQEANIFDGEGNHTTVCSDNPIVTNHIKHEKDYCGECQEYGLFVSPLKVVSSEDVLLAFHVVPEESADADLNQVKLYFVDNDDFIANAFDDGSPSTGDEEANDGVYTSTHSFNFPEIGTVDFKAVVGSAVYFGSVSVVDGEEVAGSSVLEELATKFYDKMYIDQLYLDALQQTYNEFIANLPTNVNAEDVVLTLGDFPSLSWTTLEGLTEVLAPKFPYPFEDIAPSVGAGGRRNLDQNHRKVEESGVLKCLDGMKGIEISFHGTQNSNFLWDYGRKANVLFERYTSVFRPMYVPASSYTHDYLDILKNLQQYDAISIVAPTRPVQYKVGGKYMETVALFTDLTLAYAKNYAADLVAKRIINVNGYLGLTPSFFRKYTGSDNNSGSVIYIGGSNSIDFAPTFKSLGFGAFFGHGSPLVASDVWVSLFNGEEAGNAPCIDRGECILTTTAPSYSFSRLCEESPVAKLEVTYTWPTNQADLDTGTEFLGAQTGYGCGGTSYVDFQTGDITDEGGKEVVIIDLKSSLDEGKWDQDVIIDLKAGWYSQASGSGPASVSFCLYDIIDDEIKRTMCSGIQSISPGSQSSCSSTCVGSIYVSREPRLRAQLTLGSDVCGKVPAPPQSPQEKKVPTECEQGYYNIVDFDPSGPGQWGVATFYPDPIMSMPFTFQNEIAYVTTTNLWAILRARQLYGYQHACGVGNAFMHTLFNYELTRRYKSDMKYFVGDENIDDLAIAFAKKWGDAHEISINGVEGHFPDSMRDLLNNDVGRKLAIEQPKFWFDDIVDVIHKAKDDGRLTIDPVYACNECKTMDGREGLCLRKSSSEEDFPCNEPKVCESPKVSVPWNQGQGAKGCEAYPYGVECCVDALTTPCEPVKLDGYRFYLSKDSWGGDIPPQYSTLSIVELGEKCSTNPTCKGFTTNGYLKKDIKPDTELDPFEGECTGLYKKDASTPPASTQNTPTTMNEAEMVESFIASKNEIEPAFKFYPDLESGGCLNDGEEDDYQSNLFDTLEECCNTPWFNKTKCMVLGTVEYQST